MGVSLGSRSQRNISSGVAELDDMLGGGLPLGSICLVIEDPLWNLATPLVQELAAAAAKTRMRSMTFIGDSRGGLESTWNRSTRSFLPFFFSFFFLSLENSSDKAFGVLQDELTIKIR